MQQKRYNPKSHAPAVYIPNWLVQVSNKLLSFPAKLLYGRLAQWSNSKGDVFRSCKQLAREIGSTERSVNDYLKELREAKLIGTFLKENGGLNHFVFYDHPWMYEEIDECLDYESCDTPRRILRTPHAESCVPPTQNPAYININKVKRNKKDLKTLVLSDETTEKTQKDFSVKNEKKIKASDYRKDERFMKIFKAYPVKKKTAHAYKMWLKLDVDDAKMNMILDDIENRLKNDSQWQDGYIQHLGTYLNPESPGFEDEIFNRDALKKQQSEIQKEQTRKNIEHQLEQSRKRAEIERANDFNKQQDAVTYRSITKKAMSKGEIDAISRLKSIVK